MRYKITPYSAAERHRGNFEKSHYPTVVQVGCKLIMGRVVCSFE